VCLSAFGKKNRPEFVFLGNILFFTPERRSHVQQQSKLVVAKSNLPWGELTCCLVFPSKRLVGSPGKPLVVWHLD
jgi:hypothetical protein